MIPARDRARSTRSQFTLVEVSVKVTKRSFFSGRSPEATFSARPAKGVDRLVVVLGTDERVVAGHSPVTRLLPGAHAPGGLDRRTVGQVVPVPLDVGLELVGDLAGPGAGDEPEPVVLPGQQVRRRQHPGVSHDTMSCAWWRPRNRVRTGIRVVVSALLPSNRSTSTGNPVAVVSSPTVTCGPARCSLLIPALRSLSSRSASKGSDVTS